MAMAFTFRVLHNGARNYVLQANGADASTTVAATSNGTSNGIIAANGYAAVTSHLKINRILYTATNLIIRLQWHATANVDLAYLNGGYGDLNLDEQAGKSLQGVWNDGGTGVTGDIDITTTAINAVTAATGPTAAMTMILFCNKGV